MSLSNFDSESEMCHNKNELNSCRQIFPQVDLGKYLKVLITLRLLPSYWTFIVVQDGMHIPSTDDIPLKVLMATTGCNSYRDKEVSNCYYYYLIQFLVRL